MTARSIGRFREGWLQVLRRGVSSASIIAVSVVALAGCTPAPPIYAMISDGDLTVRVCEEFKAPSIKVVSRERGQSESSIVWLVSSDEDTPIGFQFEVGTAPESFMTESEFDTDGLSMPIVTISIGTFGPGEVQPGPVGSSRFELDEMRDGSWYDQDGVATPPCEPHS